MVSHYFYRMFLATSRLLVVFMVIGTVGGCGASQHPSAAQAAGCRATSAFHAASPLRLSQPFPDVPLPPNTIGIPGQTVATGKFDFSIASWDVCVSSLTAAALTTFFAQKLARNGWQSASYFPFDGAYQAACNPQYQCWSKDSIPRLVAIDHPLDGPGTTVSFHLWLAQPPAPVVCHVFDVTGKPNTYSAYLPGLGLQVPLPPLTQYGEEPAATETLIFSLCSPGTAQSLQAFLASAMPKAGFLGAGTDWQDRTNTLYLHFHIDAASLPYWGVDASEVP